MQHLCLTTENLGATASHLDKIGIPLVRPLDLARRDHAVGLSRLWVGPAVNGDVPICLIHAASEDAWGKAAESVRASVEIVEQPCEAAPGIVDRLA